MCACCGSEADHRWRGLLARVERVVGVVRNPSAVRLRSRRSCPHAGAHRRRTHRAGHAVRGVRPADRARRPTSAAATARRHGAADRPGTRRRRCAPTAPGPPEIGPRFIAPAPPPPMPPTPVKLPLIRPRLPPSRCRPRAAADVASRGRLVSRSQRMSTPVAVVTFLRPTSPAPGRGQAVVARHQLVVLPQEPRRGPVDADGGALEPLHGLHRDPLGIGLLGLRGERATRPRGGGADRGAQRAAGDRRARSALIGAEARAIACRPRRRPADGDALGSRHGLLRGLERAGGLVDRAAHVARGGAEVRHPLGVERDGVAWPPRRTCRTSSSSGRRARRPGSRRCPRCRPRRRASPARAARAAARSPSRRPS